LAALGRTAEAAALIDPLTTGPADGGYFVVQVARAEIALLRGDTEAAAGRWQPIYALPAIIGKVIFAYEWAARAVEVSLWAGRPDEALQETRRALALFKGTDLTFLSGRLLAAGMRACADLAEQARARRDQFADADAKDAADGLATWVERMGGAPFTDHRYVAAIPAERATWDAEQTRVAGPSDPEAWGGAAKAWQDLGWPHRAGYALWRQAQAQLDGGQPATAATAAVRAAAAAAGGHAPLLAQIRTLAERARIPLQPPAAAEPATPPPAPGTAGLQRGRPSGDHGRDRPAWPGSGAHARRSRRRCAPRPRAGADHDVWGIRRSLWVRWLTSRCCPLCPSAAARASRSEGSCRLRFFRGDGAMRTGLLTVIVPLIVSM
jgi:hypothetical protein